MEIVKDDKLTIILRVKQGPHETTYHVTNFPDWDWYELLGMFSLYCIIAMSVFYIGIWNASKYITSVR